MLSAVDDGVGRIVATLRQYGLEERTLIFFIGDNGAPLKIHKLDAPGGGPGWDGSLNDPLNGEKGMLAEGGIRVPFVVSWAGHLNAGSVYRHPVISLDVAATAIAQAGLPPDPALDGVDLVPYLCGDIDGAPHQALFWRWIAQAAVREGDWKYLRGGARQYLFNLEDDPEEQHDLLAEHPEIAARLQTQLAAWSQELQPPGLETNQMAETWERYFDYYLDGKPAPEPATTAQPNPATVSGWLARGGILNVQEGALQVRPAGGKQRPFIVVSGLELPAELQAVVRLKTPAGGAAGFAWREAGQRDFSPQQVVMFDCAASPDWQEQRVAIAGNGPVIHVRLLLPETGADIDSIIFADPAGRVLRAWDFREK
jgi:uncharacterized sulfatase